jgi:hypothetical protein
MDGKSCKLCGCTDENVTYSATQQEYLCVKCYVDQFPVKPFPAFPAIGIVL